MSLSGQKGFFERDPKEVPQPSTGTMNIRESRYLDLFEELSFVREMSPGLDGWREKLNLQLTGKKSPSPETTSRAPAPQFNNPPSNFFPSGNFPDWHINAALPVKRAKWDPRWGPDAGIADMGVREFAESSSQTREESFEVSGPSSTFATQPFSSLVDQSILSFENRITLATLAQLFGSRQQPFALPSSVGPGLASGQPNQRSGSQEPYDPFTDAVEERKEITVEDGKKRELNEGKNGKALHALKFSLAEFVKNLLSPTWKEGRLSKEDYKMIVKKVVDKVIATIKAAHIPRTRHQTEVFLSCSKPKLEKLVQAYVEKYQKKQVT